MTKRLRDEVEFKGVIYTRFPDSENKNQQRYYYAPRKSGRGLLHRDLWIDAYGPIPAGHDIHHIDENPLNNSLDNLVPLTKKQHSEMHAAEYSAVRREWMNSIRYLASEWHGSPDGLKWHQEHGKAVWIDREPDKVTVCGFCGNSITKFFVGRSKEGLSFCGANCRARFRTRAKKDMVVASCPVCTKAFDQNKFNSRPETCSRECGQKLSWSRRKAVAIGYTSL